MKLIIAAIDSSPAASAAMHRAARLAADAGARLVLLHVAQQRSAWARVADAVPPLESLHREAARIRAEHGIPVAVYLAKGVPHKEIAAFARDAKADLVVVGLRGGFMQELLGTGTAQRVRRRVAVPVLAVPREPRGPYRRILIATDFSPASERAAALVGRLFPQAQVHLLNVSRPPFDGMLALADVKESVREEYRRRAVLHAFRGLSAFALHTGLERASLDVQLGHPAARIRESAAQIGADLLVLAPSAKAWLEHVLVGSVTDAVLPQADCDTLVASDAPGIARRARDKDDATVYEPMMPKAARAAPRINGRGIARLALFFFCAIVVPLIDIARLHARMNTRLPISQISRLPAEVVVRVLRVPGTLVFPG